MKNHERVKCRLPADPWTPLDWGAGVGLAVSYFGTSVHPVFAFGVAPYFVAKLAEVYRTRRVWITFSPEGFWATRNGQRVEYSWTAPVVLAKGRILLSSLGGPRFYLSGSSTRAPFWGAVLDGHAVTGRDAGDSDGLLIPLDVSSLPAFRESVARWAPPGHPLRALRPKLLPKRVPTNPASPPPRRQLLDSSSRNTLFQVDAERLPKTTVFDTPHPFLAHVRQELKDGSYVCTGVIGTSMPAFTALAGTARSSSPDSTPPLWVKRSSPLDEKLKDLGALQRALRHPLTHVSLQPLDEQTGEFCFRRAVLAEDTGSEKAGLSDEGLAKQSSLQAMEEVHDILGALQDLSASYHEEASSPQTHSSSLSTEKAAVAMAKVPEDAALTLKTVLHCVRETTGRFSGSVEQVGEGVEARISLGIDDGTDNANVIVNPAKSGFSISVRAELPERPGETLHISSELGAAAWLRSWRELKVGDDALDDAFLLAGNPERLSEVRAAKRQLLRIARRGSHVELQDKWVHASMAIPGDVDDINEAISVALEMWAVIRQHRQGFGEDAQSPADAPL